jgi:hypothetical protein
MLDLIPLADLPIVLAQFKRVLKPRFPYEERSNPVASRLRTNDGI